uniref:Putative secreted protein n=1 Tax=Anopheles darlingi TaxID=43151 RepID=A0A2M4DPL5_ANODA
MIASFGFMVLWFTEVVRWRRGFGERTCDPNEFDRFVFEGTVAGEAGHPSGGTSASIPLSIDRTPSPRFRSRFSFGSLASLSEEAELGGAFS